MHGQLEVIPDASGATLRDFVVRNIAPGSTVITDALQSYNIIVKDGFTHEAINVKRSGLKAHQLLPGVHRVASLLKSWIKGTLQGGISPEHMQAYLDEFTFRFNRRGSRQRGMLFFRLLEQAVQTGPLTYKNLVAVPAPKRVKPAPPGKRAWPGTLAVDPLDRPWRSV
ncbi:MAG: IS1595 family transposase [Mycobacteriales bacterium]